jgi:BolA protein
MNIQNAIEAKLTDAFTPQELQVTNESHMHNVPPGSESHFKVVLVSDAFSGLRQVKRHQLIYAELSAELAGPIHALALHTYAPADWAEASVPQSPDCLGGSKSP